MIDKIEGRIVNDILVIPSEIQDNLFEKVCIDFNDFVLQIEVDDSTDELILSFKDKKIQEEETFKKANWSNRFEGKQVISFWLCKNQKGYFDCLCIGLDEFIPSVVITSIISHIEVRCTHVLS